MTQIKITYEKELSTRCVHLDTGTEITTDAPKDNQGLGRSFSPTDLLAASFGSCVLTLMGIAAKKLGVDIQGTTATVVKQMQTAPFRRIGRIDIEIFSPHHFPLEVIDKLVQAAEKCPVRYSLHPDIEVKYTYHWGKL